MSSRKATESFCFDHIMQQIYEEDNKSALERQASRWRLNSKRFGALGTEKG